MSDTNELVRMANQIAAFFASYPHEEAVTGMAQHIRDFWDPRMRTQMAGVLEAGGAGLDPLAREGVARALARAAAA